MCGVAGILSLKPTDNQSMRSEVGLMVRAISHRGPDHEGLWSGDNDEQICLGHRRLAIIDISEDGNQPMISIHRHSVLAFNGEIYNYKELRVRLELEGAKFHGSSDTEVLLCACESWGIKLTLKRLVGMFAFALWDRVERKLFLARDRAGKKPLYFGRFGDRIYFASEIKAFKAVKTLSLSIDEDALHHYLTLGFIPSSNSIYHELNIVPAGQWMQFDINGGVKHKRYWSPAKESSEKISFNDAVERTEELLRESVKLRLRADVPVGVFLSGGIDSGLITAMAAQQSQTPLRTFTVSFGELGFDESEMAMSVARRYKTQHEVIKLNPNLEDLLPNVVAAYDEPFADPSALPTYAVSEIAAKHVKVVLNGEGADELFGGYRRHTAIKYFSKMDRVFNILPNSLLRKGSSLLPKPSTSRSPYGFFHRFIRGFGQSAMQQYLVWSSDGFNEKEKQAMWKERMLRPATDLLLQKDLEYLGERGVIGNFMAADFVLGMGQCLLKKMDIATMAHSIEARSPFLDHRLSDFAFSLNHNIILSGNSSKPILRELAGKLLPKQVVVAPKRGFEIPLVYWVEEKLYEMIYDTCLRRDGLLTDLFETKELKGFLSRDSISDKGQWAKRVWILFMLALWDEHN